VIADDDDAAVAAITVADLLVGVHLADGAHRPNRQAFVDDVIDVVATVDYGEAVASSHAELVAFGRRQGRPSGAHDLIIAATAKATQREVVPLTPPPTVIFPESSSGPTEPELARRSAWRRLQEENRRSVAR
jgi:tRNA(fMet)-specific endonuclease VapC